MVTTYFHGPETVQLGHQFGRGVLVYLSGAVWVTLKDQEGNDLTIFSTGDLPPTKQLTNLREIFMDAINQIDGALDDIKFSGMCSDDQSYDVGR